VQHLRYPCGDRKGNTEHASSINHGAVIIDEQGRALVIRRADTGAWEPPGGILELDETINDRLRREVREKTGLEIEPERLTGIDKNMPTASPLSSSAAASQAVSPTERRGSWASVATSDHVDDKVTAAFGVRILDAFQDAQPAIRIHDGTHIRGFDPVHAEFKLELLWRKARKATCQAAGALVAALPVGPSRCGNRTGTSSRNSTNSPAIVQRVIVPAPGGLPRWSSMAGLCGRGAFSRIGVTSIPSSVRMVFACAVSSAASWVRSRPVMRLRR
jgi:8-oxo-dGTP diphosphatase